VTDRWTPSQLTGTLRWVLSLEYAGGTWYLGQESITIDDGAGGTIVISDGLLDLADTTETLDLWSTDSPRRSVPVEFDLGIDVATLIEQGHDLAGCVAELAQLADGDDWSARRPFVVGRLQEPQYGADGEGVRASIEQDVLSSDEAFVVQPVIGKALEAVLLTLGYFALAVAEADASAPYIIGSPGGGTQPGSVAPYSVQMNDGVGLPYNFYLLAAHAVEATTVTLVNPDNATTVLASVLHVTLLGETIALAVEAAALTTMTPTKVPVVVWDAGGGLIDEAIGVLETAGDFLALLLRLTEQQVDYGRTNAARESLRAFTVGTYIDESITVADYIRDAVLDIVPVSIMTGPNGVYPHVWRWDATAADAVAHFDTTEDPDIEREGLVTYEDGDKIANTVTLAYQWSPLFEGYTSVMTSRGDGRVPRLQYGAGAGDPLDYYADPVLASSFARYGVKRATVETALVHDVMTATRVLAWRSRRWALPSRVVEYTCPQRWAWIEPGDFITVTDPELAWSERLCLVQSRAWASDGAVRYTLRVQEG
jgi:hypothetical protein